MKKLLLLILLIPTSLFAFEVNEYKGLPVTYDIGACNNTTFFACYYYTGEREGTINIEKYTDEFQYNQILEHEYAHHIYDELFSDRERAIWDIIVDEEKMTELLEGKGIDMTITHVSWYAMTDKHEDFAESFAREYDGKLKTYKDIKQFFSRYLYEQVK